MIEIIEGCDPESTLDALCDRGDGIVAVRYSFAQYYLADSPIIDLIGVFAVSGGGQWIGGLVTDQIAAAQDHLDGVDVGDVRTQSSQQRLREIGNRLGAPLIDFGAPLRLAPTHIPKPWGQEIWYTGIELRGQSGVTDGVLSVPLPWVLSLARRRLLGNSEQLNLLKILDPRPEPVYGDLYFELHEIKREVYIVTHIDRQAWPDGEGAIRFGFDQHLRAQYPTDADFRAAYLNAVLAYEQIRRKIDCELDQRRLEMGLSAADPVAADAVRHWLDCVSAEDRADEEQLRAAMNRFTQSKPLKVGDVVKVPRLVPHALQHGVRTVEFQTPVYERKILSFAQKVLTQEHWDTRAAVALMSVETPPDDAGEIVEIGVGLRRELVVGFEDFDVQRLTLTPGAEWRWPADGDYALAMTLVGCVSVGEVLLEPESAALVPARRLAILTRNSGDEDAELLISRPRRG
ncbi:MAG: hypothetical protein ACSLE5_12580 [Porticoccaceae bacterium]